MRKLLFIPILVLLFSCNKEKQNAYAGDWYFDKIIDYDSSKTHMDKYRYELSYEQIGSFSISNDSVFEKKSGFFYRINNIVKTGSGHSSFISSDYFLGTKTECKIEKSKISFFDKTTRNWKEIRIKEINGDTMIAYGDLDVKFKLVRKHNSYLNRSKYDAITVDRSPCFGSCPSNSTYIDRNGDFYFKANSSNTQWGQFSSKLEPEAVAEIFDKFDKIDILELNNYYSSGGTCGPTNTISFFKDGKIIKTIECYREGPEDLTAAYLNLSYVYQRLGRCNDNQFVFGDDKVNFNFLESKKGFLNLGDSESFYLEVALRKGKKVNTAFKATYLLDFYVFEDDMNVKKITTDGRFYKIEMKDTTLTVDIGYNFIKLNQVKIHKNSKP